MKVEEGQEYESVKTQEDGEEQVSKLELERVEYCVDQHEYHASDQKEADAPGQRQFDAH